MKRFLLIALSVFTLSAYAQPVIMNGDNIASPGYSTPVSIGTPSGGVGSGGEDQTWDFSSVIFAPVGVIDVIDPSTSPIGASFPSANYAYAFASNFSFFEVSSTKMEVLAYVINTPGIGNDYSPNPRTNLIFPFNYLDSANDTWQKTGESPNTVEITYDGFGTLITPTGSYSDVVRVKEDYGGGGIDYQWYILNPLMAVFIYDHNENLLYNIDAELIIDGIENNNTTADVNIFPNPTKDNFELQITDLIIESTLTLDVFNVYGQIVAQYHISDKSTNINVQNLPASVYLYQLRNESGIVKSGKLIVE